MFPLDGRRAATGFQSKGETIMKSHAHLSAEQISRIKVAARLLNRVIRGHVTQADLDKVTRIEKRLRKEEAPTDEHTHHSG
jgi:predicted ATPase with chaperone activity